MELEDILAKEDIDKIKETGEFHLEGRAVTFKTEYVKALVNYVQKNHIKLTGLSLTCCGLTSEAIPYLCQLNDLQFLDLSENDLTSRDVEQLRDALRRLEDLEISCGDGNNYLPSYLTCQQESIRNNSLPLNESDHNAPKNVL